MYAIASVLRAVLQADAISVIESDASHSRHELELNETVRPALSAGACCSRAAAWAECAPRSSALVATVVRFMREYHALPELRHPRIIAVYDYGVDREGLIADIGRALALGA